MLFDKKIGPLAKLDKRNKTRSKKKIGDDVMSANCDVIIFPIYGQIGAFRKLDSGRVACKTYIFINSNFFFCKT